MDIKQNRLSWVDLLRLVALLMVIAAHSVDIYNATPQADQSATFWGSFLGSAMRPCVPLFAMMTGLLLLPATESASVIYRKRIPRVAIPALLWSAIYCLMPWFIGLVGGGVDTIRIFFPFAFEPSTEIGNALNNVAIIPFDFGDYTTHMWYIYMLIGLYFVLPFISTWLKESNLVRTFMTLWAVSLTLPYAEWIVGSDILGICAWNPFGMFHYFGGFVGYMILGWMLGQGTPKGKAWKSIALGSIMYITGFLFTWKGHSTMSSLYSYEENPAMLELFWQYLSPNVALMTIGIFLITQRIKVCHAPTQHTLALFTKHSFGCYLVHYLFIGPATMLVAPLHLPIPAGVALTVMIVFAASWSLSAIMHLVCGRASKYIIG